MVRPALLAISMALLAGCGAGGGRAACSAAGSCPAGSYCAFTDDGGVCWPDADRPQLGDWSCACGDGGCARDSALRCTVAIRDEVSMGTVRVALDVDPDHPVELARTGADTFALDVPLGDHPFPYFQHDLVVTVTAADEAGNEQTATQDVPVTRLKWAVQVRGATALALSAPALLPDGTIAMSASDGRLYLVSSSTHEVSSVQLGTSAPSGPPAVGSDAIWVASGDGSLHEIRLDGTVVTLPANCSTAQALVGPPAVSGSRAFVGSASSILVSASSAGFCSPLALTGQITSPPAITSTGHVLANAGGTLRSFSVSGAGLLSDEWTGSPPAPVLGDTVSAPLAVDGSSAIWALARNGTVSRVLTPSAQASAVTTAGVTSPGLIILSDGSAVVSDSGGKLVRVSASGAVPWAETAALEGAPAVGLALGGDDPTILVPTDQGRVYAIGQADGAVRWAGAVSSQALQPANVRAEDGAGGTAYLAGEDGYLYAVAVDGALDTAAPWPKAYHDARNTSWAGATP